MTTAQKILLNYGAQHFDDSYTFGSIPATWATLRYFAVRQGEVFHAMPCQSDGDKWRLAIASWGYAYSPVHPSTVYEDVEGATYAKFEDGYWRFAHCSPHEQIDFAASAERFCYSAFQEHIDRALNSAETGANTKARALIDFATQAGRDVFNTVRLATLGEYHRNPHHDHRRDLALASIVKVWTAWLKNAGRVADRTAISSIVGAVGARLGTDYTIEWRHERAPILAAKGQDPISGKEWCYTLCATNAAITGAENLPDPNWHFDAFAVGGITKGTQTYTDGEPRATEALPWIKRFHRNLPLIVPAPGVSIGSVAWTQEDAYRGYTPPED